MAKNNFATALLDTSSTFNWRDGFFFVKKVYIDVVSMLEKWVIIRKYTFIKYGYKVQIFQLSYCISPNTVIVYHTRRQARAHTQYTRIHIPFYYYISNECLDFMLTCHFVKATYHLTRSIEYYTIAILIERSFIKIMNVLRRNDLPFSIFKAHVSKHLVQFFILRNLITDNENVLKKNNNTYNYVTIIS